MKKIKNLAVVAERNEKSAGGGWKGRKKVKRSDEVEFKKSVLLFLKSVWKDAAKRQGLSKKDSKKFVNELEKVSEEWLKSNKSQEEFGKVVDEVFKKYGIDESKW